MTDRYSTVVTRPRIFCSKRNPAQPLRFEGQTNSCEQHRPVRIAQLPTTEQLNQRKQVLSTGFQQILWKTGKGGLGSSGPQIWTIFQTIDELQARPDLIDCTNFYVNQASVQTYVANNIFI